MIPSSVSQRTLLLALFAATAAVGQAQTLYAGPGWDQVTSIGYRQPYLSTRPGATAGAGYGIGSVYQSTPTGFIGTRALKWDANGYTILGGLGQTAAGVSAGSAIATNAAGTIVGSAGKYDASGTDLGGRAVRWDAGTTTATELGVLGTSSAGYTISTANAINAGGTIVGSANKYVNGVLQGNNAVRWDAGTNVATELKNLGGTNSSGTNTSEADGVNNAGTAFGWSQKFTDTPTNLGGLAVRWDAGSTVATELGNLGTSNGVTDSRAYAINSKGDIVGYAFKYDGTTAVGNHAVLWAAGGTAARDLGTLGSSTSGASNSVAVAINDSGMVAGYSTKYVNGASLGNRGVRWLPDGTVQELGVLDPLTFGTTTSVSVSAMNASGIVVGTDYGTNTRVDTDDRAVMWGLDGVAIDLNSLLVPNSGWLLTSAVAISDTGLITGIGYYDPDGSGPLGSYTRAYAIQLVNPVPEPAPLAALALGALSLLRRRRKA